MWIAIQGVEFIFLRNSPWKVTTATNRWWTTHLAPKGQRWRSQRQTGECCPPSKNLLPKFYILLFIWFFFLFERSRFLTFKLFLYLKDDFRFFKFSSWSYIVFKGADSKPRSCPNFIKGDDFTFSRGAYILVFLKCQNETKYLLPPTLKIKYDLVQIWSSTHLFFV